MPKKLTHPDSNTTIEVNDDVVATYESQGWESTANGALHDLDDVAAEFEVDLEPENSSEEA